MVRQMKGCIIPKNIAGFAVVAALLPLGLLFGHIESWNNLDISMQTLMFFFAVWPLSLVLVLLYGHNINLSKYKEVK